MGVVTLTLKLAQSRKLKANMTPSPPASLKDAKNAKNNAKEIISSLSATPTGKN